MPYVLGITVGTGWTGAGLSRRHRTGWSEVEPVALDAGRTTVPTSVRLGPDGSVTGGPGQPRVYGFLDRVGDEVPLLVDGWRLQPADLVAELAGWVVDQVAPREQAPPERLVLVVPAGWGPYRRHLVEDALWAAGLDGVTVLPEPLAAAEAYALAAPVPPGTVLAVYTHDACSVVRRTRTDTFEPLAGTELETELAGTGADEEAVEAIVAAAAGVLPPTVRTAGITPQDVAAVLLTAEVAAIPSAPDLIRAVLPVPAIEAADPLPGAVSVARSPAARTPAVPQPLHDRYPADLPPRPPRPPLVVTPLEPPRRRTARHAARPA